MFPLSVGAALIEEATKRQDATREDSKENGLILASLKEPPNDRN